jgi:hypothetical protein
MKEIVSSITIHEIDPVLDQRLSSVAKERGKSKNLLVKELLVSTPEAPRLSRLEM